VSVAEAAVLSRLARLCRLNLGSHGRVRRDDWRVHFWGLAAPRRPVDFPCKSERPSLRTLRAAPYFYRHRRGKYANRLEYLAKRARAKKLGLWRVCPRTPYNPYEGVRTRR
jgi:hypothetical protein